MLPATPFGQLEERVRAFKSNRICPSEMWLSLFEGLSADDVPDFVENLPNELQETLIDEFYGLARYRFKAPDDADFPAVKRALREWFEKHGP